MTNRLIKHWTVESLVSFLIFIPVFDLQFIDFLNSSFLSRQKGQIKKIQLNDTCSNNGKEVLRSSVTCEKKNGCREIETHGECCPKFLCGKSGNVWNSFKKL